MTSGAIDVTVMGAGIFGLSIAWALARRGARVQVIDPHGVGAGASGGIVGALSPHVPEAWNEKKAFQLESLLRAGDWWAEVEATGGVSSGYARRGRLQPLADDAAVAAAQGRAQGAADLWQGRAEWQVVRATGAAWEPLSPSGWLVRDTLTARIDPRRALASLVAGIVARGGTVGAEGVPLGAVVWATGTAGLADLTVALGLDMGGGIKGQALSLAHDVPDAPQIFAGGLHIVPHANGTVAVGSTTERGWTDPAATDEASLEALRQRAVAVLPVLADAPVIARWAGLRPRVPSRAPLLGAWPGRHGHFVANGGFKIGFGVAPQVAKVMADLILSGDGSGIPDGFRLA